jgi:DNA processing protein
VIGVGDAGPLGEDPRDERAAGEGQHHARGDWRTLDLAALDVGAERAYWIALQTLPGMGPVTFARLLHAFGSARGAWEAGERLLPFMARPAPDSAAVLRRLLRDGAETVARRVSRMTMGVGGVILTTLDASYPRALTDVDPRPAVLYAAGDLEAFDATCVAIVGTRRASGYGRAAAAHLADELGRAGAVVVSGLALGIDGEAHRAAIDAGGRSIAVLPSPLGRIYPPRHRELARRLVATGGALVTEVGPGQSIGRPDFARRNRIIAGLASAVVVVEAPNRSGALLTAQAAIDYGRVLYAVPGPMDASNSEGPNRLIADRQADLITSPAALLHQVGVHRPRGPISVASLSESEGLVLQTLLRRSASIEELLEPTRLAPGAVASTLTLLEARGLVTSYGGVTFHPTVVARRIDREAVKADAPSASHAPA